jgi:hypothetical protein
MLRQSLLLGVAVTALAGAAAAQQRGQSREDLLDALTRHIQICGEMADTQARLSCYDRLQTQVGGVTPQSAPTPTPLQAAPPPTMTAPAPSMGTTMGSTMGQSTGSGGGVISSSPLTPQPLGVPGGGTATLGAGSPGTTPPAASDPNAAFDPRSATYRPPEQMGPKPTPQVRRTGQRSIPNFSTPQPLVSLAAANLTYGDSRYWQVTVTFTSNTPRPLSAAAECTFMNAGRPVGTDYFGPVTIQPGEQITTEMIGPPTTVYVDQTNCRVTSP